MPSRGAWGLIPAVLTFFLLLAACGDDATGESGGPATTSPPTTSPVTSSPGTTAAATTGPAANDLTAFDRARVVVGGESVMVAVADTPELRSQGLMGVTDLVDVDGMLFVFDDDVEAAFWMKDTLIPLDIWFFGADGSLVDMQTMTPCEGDPCDTYPAAAPYRYALETEVGRLDATSSLDVASIGE